MSQTTLQVRSQLLRGGDLLGGRFRVLREIGEGGFAVVYEAVHATLGYRAAIKLLKPRDDDELSEQVRERFLREARLMAQLEHPDLVHLYDYGLTPDGQPYIVMEFLTGHTLTRELWHHGAMKPLRAHRLMCRALHALELAHRAGIIHRDLKPSNLFLRYVGEPIESLCVLDFGIAFIEQQARLTRTGEYIGTPEYSSPEYVRARHVSPALDVYQMGLIFIEMLTGRPVVDTEQPLQALFAHCNGHVHVPESLRVPGLGEVLERAIHMDPARRYPNAAAFRAALEALDLSVYDALESNPRSYSLADTLDARVEEVKTWAQTFSGDVHTLEQANRRSEDAAAPDWDALFQSERAVVDLQLETPMLSMVHSELRAGEDALPGSPATSTMQSTAARQNRAPMFAVAAIALLSMGGAVGYFASAGAHTETTIATPTITANADADGPASSTPSPPAHQVTLTTTPVRASVYEGEVLLGKAPVTVSIKPGATVVLELEHNGFTRRRIAVNERTKPTIEVAMNTLEVASAEDASVRETKVEEDTPKTDPRAKTNGKRAGEKKRPTEPADATEKVREPAKTTAAPEEKGAAGSRERKDTVVIDGKEFEVEVF